MYNEKLFIEMLSKFKFLRTDGDHKECCFTVHLMGAVASSISSEPWNFYLTHQIKRTYVDSLGGRRFGVPSYL